MLQLGYNMYPFRFNYRNRRCFVAAYIIAEEERNRCSEHSSFRLLFMNRNNLNETLELYINSGRITDCNITQLRNFFGIEFDPNGFGFMDNFCQALVDQCPPAAVEIVDDELVNVEIHSLCGELKLDPNQCYRLSIMRLQPPRHRNPNKYQLALRKFPHASRQYADARDVTYCFTDDPNREVSEEEAIARFIEHEHHRAIHL